MSSIPFIARSANVGTPPSTEIGPYEAAYEAEEAAPVAGSRRSLALDVFRYVLLTVIGPAAAVLAVAAALGD
jgi:hypothetical protein